MRVDQVDSKASNDTAQVDVTVNGVDMIISIDVDENKPGENQQIVYTVGVKNNGPASLASGIVVSAPCCPAELHFVSASAQQGSYNGATGCGPWAA